MGKGLYIDCLEWCWTSNNNELLVTNVFYHNVVSLGECHNIFPEAQTRHNRQSNYEHVTWLFSKCGNLGFVMFVQLFSLQFESVRHKTRFWKPTGFKFSVEIYFCWNFSFCQIAFFGSLLPIHKYWGTTIWKSCSF